jgi:DNA polymerase I
VRVIDTGVGPLRVVSTLADAAELWSWLTARRDQVLGLDAETNARDPFAPLYQLRTVQMADASYGWVIQAQRPGMSDVIRACVRAHDQWVAWFARNDLNFIERGVPGSIRLDSYHPHLADGQVALAWHDPRTVTTASLKENIDPRISRPRGLKPAAALNLEHDYLTQAETEMHAKFRAIAPKDLRKAEDIKAYGFAHISDDDETYLRYAGLDSIVACQLWNTLVAEVWRRGKWEGCARDLRWQWHADLCQFRGQPVDGPYVRWISARFQEIIEENSRLLDWYHIKPTAAGRAIGEAFEWLREQGYLLTDNTKTSKKTGKLSWDKFVLSDIIKNEPDSYAGKLATAIQAVRKATKFDASYLKPMRLALERDGRVHPDIRVVGTISSRNSCSRPPLQQLPKKEKVLRVRPALCAPPGWVIVTADLRQGEPRTMAGLSGDLNLKRDLLTGDLYSSIATLTYGDKFNPDPRLCKDTPSSEHYKMRQAAKFGSLATDYGCGVNKYAGLLGVSIDEAQIALRRREAAYPDLTRFRNRMNQQATVELESGWIAPLWDRYYVDDRGELHLKREPSRNGLNYATQGGQRHIFSIAVHRIIDWGWSWALYMFMHDELLLCVPKEMGNEAAAVLKRAMTMEWRGMPIECDVDEAPYSDRWTSYPDEFLTSADIVAIDEEILEGV